MSKINRRDIFSHGFELGTFLENKKHQDYHDSLPNYYPVRPPGALKEEDFLEVCTRCEACVDACPYFVIEKDYSKEFDDDNFYPLLNVDHIPCQMCEDYPCIKVCESKALVIPESKPKIGEAQVLVNGCLSWQGEFCDICHPSCPEDALVFDSEERTRVIGSRCTGCGLCIEACPGNTYAIKVVSIKELQDREEDAQ